MARIRTIKPEAARHEGLFALEQETGLPIRAAWYILPTACDREGRFQWRPRSLKLDILPYDDLDFSRVLDAFLTRGFLVKYRVGGEWYGQIPTFRKHQAVNNKESGSILPPVSEADEVIQHLTNATATREQRDNNATDTRLFPTRGEGEGKGKGKELTPSLSARTRASIPDSFSPDWNIVEFRLKAAGCTTNPRDPEVMQKFIANHRSNGKTSQDWSEEFALWCIKEKPPRVRAGPDTQRKSAATRFKENLQNAIGK